MRKRRGLLSRVVAATVTVWLGLVLVAPIPLDACPMHGSHALHGVSPSAHAAHHGATHHTGAPKKAATQCTCIGDCSAGRTSLSFLPTYARTAEVLVAGVAQPPRVAIIEPRAGVSEHLHPPANGPPSIS